MSERNTINMFTVVRPEAIWDWFENADQKITFMNPEDVEIDQRSEYPDTDLLRVRQYDIIDDNGLFNRLVVAFVVNHLYFGVIEAALFSSNPNAFVEQITSRSTPIYSDLRRNGLYIPKEPRIVDYIVGFNTALTEDSRTIAQVGLGFTSVHHAIHSNVEPNLSVTLNNISLEKDQVTEALDLFLSTLNLLWRTTHTINNIQVSNKNPIDISVDPPDLVFA